MSVDLAEDLRVPRGISFGISGALVPLLATGREPVGGEVARGAEELVVMIDVECWMVKKFRAEWQRLKTIAVSGNR
jgi:hypothetical protein